MSKPAAGAAGTVRPAFRRLIGRTRDPTGTRFPTSAKHRTCPNVLGRGMPGVVIPAFAESNLGSREVINQREFARLSDSAHCTWTRNHWCTVSLSEPTSFGALSWRCCFLTEIVRIIGLFREIEGGEKHVNPSHDCTAPHGECQEVIESRVLPIFHPAVQIHCDANDRDDQDCGCLTHFCCSTRVMRDAPKNNPMSPPIIAPGSSPIAAPTAAPAASPKRASRFRSSSV